MSETPITSSSAASSSAASSPAPQWRVLTRNERRAVGVLVEKAKTTPENYPLSLNAVVTGANQKNNRSPQLQLDEGEVEEALDSLRLAGAVAQVQGSGRTDKYRHLLYDWLAVDKTELAVMAELLLRGAQTLGELRGRAARMERIAGIAELKPVVESLQRKGLLTYLTPPGRGAVVTHTLYQAAELEKLQAEYGTAPAAEAVPRSAPTPPTAESTPAAEPISEFLALREKVDHLSNQVDTLQHQLQALKDHLGV